MPDVTGQLDVLIADAVRGDLDVLVAVHNELQPELDVYVVTDPNVPQRLTSRLDMAILAMPPMGNISTTPVNSQYFERRPRWDRRIPLYKLLSSELDVVVSAPYPVTSNLDVYVQVQGQTIFAWLQVFIAPETPP